MKKFCRRGATALVALALVLTGVRLGPNLYARLFGNGNVQWISEQFSETLKDKNELVVYEVETTGQETVTQDAWLIGTVQKVVVPYTFQMRFSVDLSRAQVSANGNIVEVRIPAPTAGYEKLTVHEDEMIKNDWFYPLTPERYAEIKLTIERKLFEQAKSNPEYIQSAWGVTVRNIENLFSSFTENTGGAFQVSVIQDDTAGLSQPVSEDAASTGV